MPYVQNEQLLFPTTATLGSLHFYVATTTVYQKILSLLPTTLDSLRFYGIPLHPRKIKAFKGLFCK